MTWLSIRIWLLLFISSITVSSIETFASEQNFSIHYYDVSHGLSNNFTSEIIEDDLGIKWIATEGGLNQFDGLNFKHLKPGGRYAGLENENIETLYKDNDGYIWVGTKSGGLSQYDPRTDQFINFNKLFEKQTQLRITNICQDADGFLWVGTWNQGLFVLDIHDSVIVKTYPSNDRITDIKRDKFGNMWFSTIASLHKHNRFEDREITYETEFSIEVFNFLEPANLLILGGEHGVYKMNTDLFTFEKVNLGITYVSSIAVDSLKRVWIGSWGSGLYIGDPDLSNFEKLNLTPQHLGNRNKNYETITNVSFDHDGNTWLTTGYGGIVKLSSPNNFVYVGNTITDQINLSDNNIQSIYIDSNEVLWCGTYGGGINISLDWENFEPLNQVPVTKVNAFLELPEMMLVGAREGLFCISKSNMSATPKRHFGNLRRITELYLDDNQNLWIGTQHNGLAFTNLITDPDLTEIAYLLNDNKSGINSDRITNVYEDLKGNLWVGTYNGLFLFNASTEKFKRMDQDANRILPSVIIHSVIEDKEGNMWLGLPTGLVKTRYQFGFLNVLEIYDSDNQLEDDFITSLINDTDFNLWIGTTTGIVKYHAGSSLFTSFDRLDGIQSGSMNINSVAGYSGKILFGGTDGLMIFDPNMIKVLQEPPQIRFTQLKINNQIIETGGDYLKRIILEKGLAYTGDLRLNHKEKVFSIGFYPSDFNGSEHLIFRYRLRGLHDNWIVDQGKSELSFTGLRAGNYSLEIQGSRDNINFGNSASLGIRITPHPLKSPIAIIIYVLIFSAAFAFFWIQYRNKVKLESNLTIAKVEKEKEHEISEAKLTFFTNISHEIRTPLTLILAPVTELLSMNEISKNVRNKLSIVEVNTNRLLHMINQLLDFRRANRGLLTLAVCNGDFMRFANEIFSSFEGMAESKNIRYKFNTIPKELCFFFDKDKIEIAIYNLLSNAFKFTSKNGKVTFSIKGQNNSCIISIKDSGKGIPESELDKIFDRFYQAKSTDSAKAIGSGIGLSLTKSIVELHQGNITVNSEINKGTEFIITIPMQMVPSTESSKVTKAFEAKLPERSAKNISTGMVDNKKIISSSKETDQIILIVDDNEEIRNYLGSIMELEYQVLLAENGNVAIEIASEKIPDLVICDIMMPVMDGIEFSKQLKSQIATSHIPIILLTARTSMVHEIEGLQSGADDYIKKPFNPEILKSRVYSLLENREKFSKHLMNKVRFEPVENEVENFEEQFIRKAMNYVEEHITIENFGIEELTNYLCMSQSTLYRKIKSLTGYSISAFIRSVRVKSAAEIILKEDEKLTHVAFMVGFNDYKYFKKCFQKQFGCLPSEYRAKTINDNSTGNK